MQSVVTKSPSGLVFLIDIRILSAAKLSQDVQKHDNEPWRSIFAQPEGEASEVKMSHDPGMGRKLLF